MLNSNRAYLPKEDNLLVEFSLVEINNSKMGNYGINWNKAIKPLNVNYARDFGAGDTLQSTIGIISNLGQSINIMVGNGHAKVFDTHRVITLAGKAAKYFAGGGVRHSEHHPEYLHRRIQEIRYGVHRDSGDRYPRKHADYDRCRSVGTVGPDGGRHPLTENQQPEHRRPDQGRREHCTGGSSSRESSRKTSRKCRGSVQSPFSGHCSVRRNIRTVRPTLFSSSPPRESRPMTPRVKQMIDQPVQEFNKEEKKWYQRIKMKLIVIGPDGNRQSPIRPFPRSFLWEGSPGPGDRSLEPRLPKTWDRSSKGRRRVYDRCELQRHVH
ncbi:MAG: hypothetical protein MZV63_63485 [Marinilabiliales bacterium]|nr:hypothetical protein [Marinilabiliales bacterium]